MNVQVVECFQTQDGRLFEDPRKAEEHADDLLGQELDGLLKLARMDITRNTEYRALMAWMGNRTDLKAAIDKLYLILNFGEERTNENA